MNFGESTLSCTTYNNNLNCSIEYSDPRNMKTNRLEYSPENYGHPQNREESEESDLFQHAIGITFEYDLKANRLHVVLPSDSTDIVTNRIGNPCWVGSGGRYYCGRSMEACCVCCDGMCGPTKGCNCLDCAALTPHIKSTATIIEEAIMADRQRFGRNPISQPMGCQQSQNQHPKNKPTGNRLQTKIVNEMGNGNQNHLPMHIFGTHLQSYQHDQHENAHPSHQSYGSNGCHSRSVSHVQGGVQSNYLDNLYQIPLSPPDRKNVSNEGSITSRYQKDQGRKFDHHKLWQDKNKSGSHTPLTYEINLKPGNVVPPTSLIGDLRKNYYQNANQAVGKERAVVFDISMNSERSTQDHDSESSCSEIIVGSNIEKLHNNNALTERMQNVHHILNQPCAPYHKGGMSPSQFPESKSPVLDLRLR